MLFAWQRQTQRARFGPSPKSAKGRKKLPSSRDCALGQPFAKVQRKDAKTRGRKGASVGATVLRGLSPRGFADDQFYRQNHLLGLAGLFHSRDK